MSRPVVLLGALLAAATLTIVVILGGTVALLYAGLLLMAAAPGLPLGFLLFGRRHAAGWIAFLRRSRRVRSAYR